MPLEHDGIAQLVFPDELPVDEYAFVYSVTSPKIISKQNNFL